MRGSIQDTRYLANKSSRQNSEDKGEGSINRKAQENFLDMIVQTSAQQNELKKSNLQAYHCKILEYQG